MSLSIGQQLKNARIDRNLSLKDVAEGTHIRLRYLEALEADDFSVMPSPVQGRGFLRLYATFLGLNANAFLTEIQRDAQEKDSFAKIEEVFGEIPDTIHRRTGEEPIVDADEAETAPFLRRLLSRLGVIGASRESASLQGADAEPMADASSTSGSDPDPGSSSEVEEAVQFEPSKSPEESLLLFARIGATLRERREMLSLTYEEIEGHIHLRPHYMAALEAGKFEALPSPVQTRGMLTNYADFLDLDSEALLLQFAEALQHQRLERHIEVAQERSKKERSRRFSFGGFVAPDLIFGVGMILLMIIFAVWGLGRIADSRTEEFLAEATAPSIAEVLMSTATFEAIETATPTLVVVNTPGVEDDVAVDEGLPEDPNFGVQILVTILERSWLRVSVDGELVFEGRAQSNATFVYEGNESVEILTANGAGVRIAYNQRDQGLMGGFGEVVQRIYGPLGLLTPTVTPTSNATATPSPTMTPSPTLTPTLEAVIP